MDPATGLSGHSTGSSNFSGSFASTLIRAGSQILLQYDVHPEEGGRVRVDPACTLGPPVNGSKPDAVAPCVWETATCIYIDPLSVASDDPKPEPRILVRAKAWRNDSASVVGSSNGWKNPETGYPLGGTNGGASESSAVADSAHDIVSKHPELRCNKVTPLIIIPGLTSSNLEYRLQQSPPPLWAELCNRSTDGFQQMWPQDPKVTTSPGKFICWIANMAVSYDAKA